MVSPDAPSPRQMSHGMRKVYNGWLTLLAWGLYISAFSFTLRLGYLLFCLFEKYILLEEERNGNEKEY